MVTKVTLLIMMQQQHFYHCSTLVQMILLI